jgi:competence transcription factor ComK
VVIEESCRGKGGWEAGGEKGGDELIGLSVKILWEIFQVYLFYWFIDSCNHCKYMKHPKVTDWPSSVRKMSSSSRPIYKQR